MQFNKLYNLILQSIISQNKAIRKAMIEKSDQVDRRDKELTIQRVEKIARMEKDNKLADFICKFFCTGQLGYTDYLDWEMDAPVEKTDQKINKVKFILKKIPSIDTQNYKGTLKEFIDKYQKVIDEQQEKNRVKSIQYLNKLPQFSQKKEYPNGVVIYRVEQSRQGQAAVRKIVDLQWGKESNPWCIIARKFNALEDAWNFWTNYNGYPKHIAFQNRRLLAFSANSGFTNVWWDRKDEPHHALPLLDGSQMQTDTYVWTSEQKGMAWALKKGLTFNKETKRWDCHYGLTLQNEDLIDNHFPVKFGIINGDFDCNYCSLLKTMEGGPTEVKGETRCWKCYNIPFKERNKLVLDQKTGLYNAKNFIQVHDGDLIDGHLPIKFNKVEDGFVFRNCYSLTSLVGCPEYVGYAFEVSETKITSLQGAPRIVKGAFDCKRNYFLETLKGGPEEVGGTYLCRNNENLRSLQGAPRKIEKDFICAGCEKLETLQGGPQYVKGNFMCMRTQITSLIGAPKYVGRTLDASQCDELKSLQGCPEKIGANLWLDQCQKLTSLKGISKQIGETLSIRNCENITSLEEIKNCQIGLNLMCSGCRLEAYPSKPATVRGSLYY